MQLSQSVSVKQDHALDILVVHNAFARAEISLFGGHVTSYVPKSDNRERLWMSSAAIKDGQTPLRGGIPVCWPWFSDRYEGKPGSLPSHGYVRDQQWHVVLCEDTETGTRLTLEPSTTAGDGFTGMARLSLIIVIGKTLTVELVTCNIGDQPLRFTGALHTYFDVGNINEVSITGLSGKYDDKTRDFASFETPSAYTITAETDRVHHCRPEQLTINVSGGTTLVGSGGHDSIVVWNPWAENAKKMRDMTDDGYQHMVCVETAVTQGMTLEPDESHSLVQTIA